MRRSPVTSHVVTALPDPDAPKAHVSPADAKHLLDAWCDVYVGPPRRLDGWPVPALGARPVALTPAHRSRPLDA